MVNPRAVNRWLAIVIPIVEVLLFVYAAYVMTAEVAVNWLLRPPPASSHPARPGAAIAILVIFYVLLLLTLFSLLRVVLVIHTDPGYIPLPEPERGNNTGGGAGGGGDGDGNGDLELGVVHTRPYGHGMPGPDPVEFYEKDAFVCNPVGWPHWCDKCKAFKPDRAHHSSDVGRCVRGLDHFCPWAGGIVSEANHKFFNLFCMYTALITLFMVVSNAVFVVEQRRDLLTDSHTFVCMVVLIPLAAFFCMFTAPMTGAHIRLTLKNLTSVEEIQLKGNTFVAVYVGPPEKFPNVKNEIIIYPLQDSGKEPRRAFAILKPDQGTNVYDMGPWRNWRMTMGVVPLFWFLPIRSSYNTQGINQDYEYGSGVDQARKKWFAAHT